MARFEDGDIVTAYVVVNKMSSMVGGRQGIQAWSFDKDLAEAYMKFHSCPNFKLKKITDEIRQINYTLEESINDKIGIYNIRTKNPGKDKMMVIQVPMTGTEFDHINAECSSFMQNSIDYSLLSKGYDYLTPKWQKVMSKIMLPDVCRFVLHNKSTRHIEQMDIDQLLALARSFPANFGE